CSPRSFSPSRRYEFAMADVDTKSRRETEADGSAAVRTAEPRLVLLPAARRRRIRFFPLVINLAAIAVAVVLGRAMWDANRGAPWTRNGTVRAYVFTMAPQVAGQIVQLPVADNQFVHKGDLLMVIDPTNYNRSKPRRGRREAGASQCAEHREGGQAPPGA